MPGKVKRWDDLGYMGKHKRIWMRLGKAIRCDNSFCIGKSHAFDWSNVSGKYLEDTTDWQQLCKSCHMKQDHARRKLTDKERLQIAVNSLSRIHDEINFVMQRLAK